MVRASVFLAAAATASVALAQTNAISCGLDSLCPQSAPCCSQYGQCGVGAYCLGGCDPRSSFSLDSCVPEPVCQSKTFDFSNLDGITSENDYLGDATTTDWVMSGQAVSYQGDSVLLTMPEGSVGTLLASSTYMWYGNVKATFKTSRGAGVVTAFILLSDVKDEIDYEFVGVELTTAQTNYYYQGIPNYTHSTNISLSDTFENFHTYEIDWTPDTVTWLVDGQVGRVLNRKDTWNATANRWAYPQTPARVQLSLWPGGLASNGAGTISWAGGLVDWNSPLMQNGYYYATFDSVTMSCYNASSPPGTNTGVSYTYNNVAGTNDTVIDGDKPTVLKSLLGSGLNMDAGGSSASASGSSQATSPATIPGLSGGSPGSNPDGSVSAANPGSTSSASSSSSSSGSGDGSFSQGGSSSGSGSSSSGSSINQERVLKGSVFAAIVAVVAMMAL
ncbi:glycoside hydrolase family 16 protein [Oidiodendron maius Zn]|uniref:Crh-like protein n=1 Tax=Oidiodendron maius (strain Zn) TaxID=913774 RepID=A0A0C3DH60_OIDMZ|nr:glycoside hydrolase family 16 protein [Oidiodendron maius Zn]